MQDNPNARPYRLKAVPYYLDLVKIYGSKSTISSLSLDCNEYVWNSDGDPLLAGEEVVDASVCNEELCCNSLKYSPKLGEDVDIRQTATGSLHDIMIEDFDMGSTRSRTYWQPSMDQYFMQLMVEQVRKKNYVDGLLRKEAWKEMVLLFNAKFGFDYAVEVLKNRYKTLKRQHSLIKDLLEVDGFAWDGVRQMVVADDCVWRNYIKVNNILRSSLSYDRKMCFLEFD